MPQISITVSDQDLVFVQKLADESGISRSEMAKGLLRIGIRNEVRDRNALAVYLSMESKREDQRSQIAQWVSAYEPDNQD